MSPQNFKNIHISKLLGSKLKNGKKVLLGSNWGSKCFFFKNYSYFQILHQKSDLGSKFHQNLINVIFGHFFDFLHPSPDPKNQNWAKQKNIHTLKSIPIDARNMKSIERNASRDPHSYPKLSSQKNKKNDKKVLLGSNWGVKMFFFQKLFLFSDSTPKI